VVFSVLVVVAAAKEKANAEKVMSISVMVVNWLIVDFECKVLYQLMALIGYWGI